MDLVNVVLLLMHAACAVAIVRIAPRLRRFQPVAAPSEWKTDPLLEVWMVLILTAPLLGAVGHFDGSVWPAGALPISIPIAGAWIATGAMAILTIDSADRPSISPRAIAVTTATGAVLFLLAILNRLPAGVGQAAFAAAIVLLWVNSPARESGEAKEKGAPERTSTITLPVIIGLCAIQTIIMVFICSDWLAIAGAVSALELVIVLAAGARNWGRAMTHHVAAWTAVCGALLAIGLPSLFTVLRVSSALVAGGGREDALQLSFGVSNGFIYFAVEGAMLAALPAVMLALPRLKGEARRPVGGLIILAAAAVIGLRLGEVAQF